MALLYVYEAKGNPEDLLARYEQAGPAIKAKAYQLERAGISPFIAHITVETTDGIRIFELMESPTLEASASTLAYRPEGSMLQPREAVAWLQQQGLVDQAQRDAVRNAGLVDVDHSEAIYKVHDFHIRG